MFTNKDSVKALLGDIESFWYDGGEYTPEEIELGLDMVAPPTAPKAVLLERYASYENRANALKAELDAAWAADDSDLDVYVELQWLEEAFEFLRETDVERSCASEAANIAAAIESYRSMMV